MIKAVIIDDDIPSIDVLVKALQAHGDVMVCGVAFDLETGERLVADMQPDMVFLDMEFPKGNGREWFESGVIPEKSRVVFYTCYQRYIHDALALKAFDFLLKPFDPEELDMVIRRFRQSPVLSQRSVQPNSRTDVKPLAITTVTNAKVIANPAEVLYFRYLSDRKLWECVMTNLRRYILKRQTNADIILDYGKDFIRTHKRFIVNLRYVGIIANEDLQLLPPFDEISEIKISKSYRREVLDRFYDI